MIDLSLDNYGVTVEKDIDCIMQQIDILFNTSPYELFGEMSYGTDFEKFLHDLSVTNTEIESYIEMAIRNNVDLFDYKVSVSVLLAQGTEHDIIFADIVIYNDVDEFSKQYRID